MPTLWIKSGHPGQPPVETVVSTVNAHTLELQFPALLVQVLAQFYGHLNLDAAYPKVIVPAVSRFCLIEWTGEEIEIAADEITFTVNFFVEMPRAEQDYGGTQNDVAWALCLLKNLLWANDNFDHLGGITGIAAMSIITGADYQSPVDEDQLSDGGLLTVTYTRVNPYRRADR